jgi:hypothetical protein
MCGVREADAEAGKEHEAVPGVSETVRTSGVQKDVQAMRLRAKVDDNQREIVQALRQCGASVQSLAAVGKGVPDLLVGFRGRNYLMEVKDGKKKPSQRALTEDEAFWVLHWKGDVKVVNNVEEALKVLEV